MKKLLLRCYCVLITLAVLLLVWYNQGVQNQVAESTDRPAFIPSEPLPSRSESPIEAGLWDVVRVVDGDPLIVGDRADPGKQHRVRLIGSDAPDPYTLLLTPHRQQSNDFLALTRRKNK